MGDRKVVGIILRCMDGFIIGGLEGRYMGSFVGSFDGTVDKVGGPCVGLVIGGIITASDISDVYLNDSSHVSCRSEM